MRENVFRCHPSDEAAGTGDRQPLGRVFDIDGLGSVEAPVKKGIDDDLADGGLGIVRERDLNATCHVERPQFTPRLYGLHENLSRGEEGAMASETSNSLAARGGAVLVGVAPHRKG